MSIIFSSKSIFQFYILLKPSHFSNEPDHVQVNYVLPQILISIGKQQQKPIAIPIHHLLQRPLTELHFHYAFTQKPKPITLSPIPPFKKKKKFIYWSGD